MKKSVTWVVKEPQKPAVKINLEYKNLNEFLDSSLKLAQKLVGGYVECVPLGPNVTILCDEEGSFKQDAKNNCGYLNTLVFVGEDYDEEEGSFWGSLTDEQVNKVFNWCKRHEGEEYIPSSPVIITGDANIQKYLEIQQDAILGEWDSL